MLTDFLRYIVRKKTPVQFCNFNQTQPIGQVFGADRGMPIDRYYIERFLANNSSYVQGRVLEVGGDEYSRKFTQDKTCQFDILNVENNPAATLVGDLSQPDTLPRDEYDCFICTQTFNFIFDVENAVRGACRVLRPGGVLLATVAGICQISRYDMDRWGDYWRFTTASLERLFAPAFKGGLKIESHGNALAACAFLQGCAVEDLPNQTMLDDVDPDYQVLLTIVAQKASS